MFSVSHENWRSGRICSHCGVEFELDFDWPADRLRQCDDCKTGERADEIERIATLTRYRDRHEESCESILSKLDSLSITIRGLEAEIRHGFMSDEDLERYKGEKKKALCLQLNKALDAIEFTFEANLAH